MFIGRVKELKRLENMYDSNSLCCVVIEGEAQIGKTALTKEFCINKNCAYFCLRHAMENANKSAFYTEIRAQGFVVKTTEEEWDTALSAVFQRSLGDKIILVIDNANLLNISFRDFLPKLLKFLKEYENKARLLIIFAGTAGLTAELTDCKGLQKYIDTKIELEPLSFWESEKFLSNFDLEDKLLLYGVTGGYPSYLQYLDGELSLKDNLLKLFYTNTAPLLNKPEQLLRAKLREPATYNSILCSIACGATRLTEIADAVGIETNKLSKYLNVLLKLGFLNRIVPITECHIQKQHKKTYYMLNNTMMEFWYQFVFPYVSIITMNKGNALLRNSVLNRLESYYEKVFRKICRQHCYLLLQRDNFPLRFTEFGHMWNNVIEMSDGLLLASNNEQACFIACYWDKKKADLDIITDLIKKAEPLEYSQKYYLLFSRKGFTEKARAFSAKRADLRLISLQYLN